MVLIPLKNLKELLKSVNEDESTDSLSYEEFKSVYENNLKKYQTRTINKDDAIGYTLNSMEKYLAEKNVRFVGEGSSRMVFFFSQGKCVKIAKKMAGIAQNKTEIENMKSNEYICFPQVYDFDNKTNGSLLVECGNEIYENEEHDNIFKNLYGVQQYDFFKYIVELIESLKTYTPVEYISFLEEEADFFKTRDKYLYEEYQEQAEFIYKILHTNEIQYKVLRDLLRFYYDNGTNSMLVSDLRGYNNWAFVIREHKLVPIIIDAGFSEYVRHEYYF